MSDQPQHATKLRAALRVLRLVHELHKVGHQRLRIAPGMSPTGFDWRCSITHAGNILASDGASARHWDRESVHYSTGSVRDYFG